MPTQNELEAIASDLAASHNNTPISQLQQLQQPLLLSPDLSPILARVVKVRSSSFTEMKEYLSENVELLQHLQQVEAVNQSLSSNPTHL